MSSFMHLTEKDGGSLSAAELLDMRQRLDDELKQIKIAHTAASYESDASDIEQLQERVSELREELLEESVQASKKTLFVQRFQLGKALCDSLFSNRNDYTDRSIVKACLEELDQTIQLMRILEETVDLQGQCESQTMANLTLKAQNTELLQKLKEKQKEKIALSADAAKNKEYKRLVNQLETKRVMVQISKHIGQLLVPHLDEDLNQDDLRDFLIKCSEPIDV